MSKFWSNLDIDSTHDYDVLSVGLSCSLSSYCESLWNGLHVALSTGNRTVILPMEATAANKDKIEQKAVKINRRIRG